MSNDFLLATRKGLFHFTRANGAWQIERVHFLGDNCTMALADPRDGTWYAGLNLGHFGVKLHRSRDRGATWQPCAVPTYPAGAVVSAGPVGPDETPKTKPASLDEIWALEAGGADQPNRLWAGTIPGGLFRSDDAGDSWQLIESLWDKPERLQFFGGGKDNPGIHSICIDPRNSRKLTIGISCGGVWQSEDDGVSWVCTGEGLKAEYLPPDMQGAPHLQDPHLLVQCPAQPEMMWIQHHNGIFASQDYARTWQQITPTNVSSFGFAVCVHPNDGRKAWFVPAIKDECRVPSDARLIVSLTTDAGKNFAIQSAGLPQKDCYEIVYRHSMAIDKSGNTLVFGTTTGGLWITDNGGQQWTMLGHNLPPIYCVKFA